MTERSGLSWLTSTRCENNVVQNCGFLRFAAFLLVFLVYGGLFYFLFSVFCFLSSVFCLLACMF